MIQAPMFYKPSKAYQAELERERKALERNRQEVTLAIMMPFIYTEMAMFELEVALANESIFQNAGTKELAREGRSIIADARAFADQVILSKTTSVIRGDLRKLRDFVRKEGLHDLARKSAQQTVKRKNAQPLQEDTRMQLIAALALVLQAQRAIETMRKTIARASNRENAWSFSISRIRAPYDLERFIIKNLGGAVTWSTARQRDKILAVIDRKLITEEIHVKHE